MAANDLVSMDKSGDPIYYFVTEQNLPSVPRATVFEVYDNVKLAVEAYYEHNTIRGCTKENSPNFCFQANVDDGSCHPTKTNFSFGGVYQTCENSGIDDNCHEMTQKNPQTGDYSCPTGYEAVLIKSDTKKYSRHSTKCHRCWLFFHCCHTETQHSKTVYSAYWCAANGVVPENNGFLFGGLYTDQVENIVTQSKSCPLKFYNLTILNNLHVCVSDDYELGAQFSLPFAGFISCNAGNPLALKERFSLLKSNRLNSFMLAQGVASYPKACPYGYSQHLAVIENGCKIEYCVKSGSLSAEGLPKVKRPPFMEEPRDIYSTMNSDFVVDDAGDLWTNMQNADKVVPTFLQRFGFESPLTTMSPSKNNDATMSQTVGSKASTLSSGAVIGIAIGSTLICLIVASFIFVRVRRGRVRYRQVDLCSNPDERRHIISSAQ